MGAVSSVRMPSREAGPAAKHLILPILSQHTTQWDTDMETAPDEIRSFLQGPDPSFANQSEHYMVRGSNYGISLAQIWAAMAMFKGSQDRRIQNVFMGQEQDESGSGDDEEFRHSKRVRRHTLQSDFVESGGIQAGSSSPLQEGYSSSARSSSIAYVDSDTHFSNLSPEDDTLRLISCVIRHILYFAAPQNLAWHPKVVEFRDAKRRLATYTPYESRQIVAIDDGGLCLRQKDSNGGFIIVDNYVAILEAKTQFQCLENGRPIISDDCFAQMVCEALVAGVSKLSSHSNQSVILIHATQQYVCFLQFDLNKDYLFDFESTAPEQFLNVSATPWFDLSQRSGRENVLANICGIMRLAISNE